MDEQVSAGFREQALRELRDALEAHSLALRIYGPSDPVSDTTRAEVERARERLAAELEPPRRSW